MVGAGADVDGAAGVAGAAAPGVAAVGAGRAGGAWRPPVRPSSGDTR